MDLARSISLAFGTIEIKGWDIVGFGQIGDTWFSDREGRMPADLVR